MKPSRVELELRVSLCAFGSAVAVAFGEPHLAIACCVALTVELLGVVWSLRA